MARSAQCPSAAAFASAALRKETRLPSRFRDGVVEYSVCLSASALQGVSSPLCVITGGPGTGKTAALKARHACAIPFAQNYAFFSPARCLRVGRIGPPLMTIRGCCTHTHAPPGAGGGSEKERRAGGRRCAQRDSRKGAPTAQCHAAAAAAAAAATLLGRLFNRDASISDHVCCAQRMGDALGEVVPDLPAGESSSSSHGRFGEKDGRRAVSSQRPRFPPTRRHACCLTREARLSGRAFLRRRHSCDLSGGAATFSGR